jgi:hypothetical protein
MPRARLSRWEDIGSRVSVARTLVGFTQLQLAERLGLHRSAITGSNSDNANSTPWSWRGSPTFSDAPWSGSSLTKGVLIFDTTPAQPFRAGWRTRHATKACCQFRMRNNEGRTRRASQRCGCAPSLQDAIDLEWLTTVSCDELDELYLFGQYLNRLGNFERNAGEASVLAWAEAHSAAAYVDDQVACNVGRSRGVRVHRMLQLVISAFRSGALSESKAQALVKAWPTPTSAFPPQPEIHCSNGHGHETHHCCNNTAETHDLTELGELQFHIRN